jgi:hypothetical protein
MNRKWGFDRACAPSARAESSRQSVGFEVDAGFGAADAANQADALKHL